MLPGIRLWNYRLASGAKLLLILRRWEISPGLRSSWWLEDFVEDISRLTCHLQSFLQLVSLIKLRSFLQLANLA